MPGINTRKQYVVDGYYHIYSRGHSKELLFRDDKDYAVYLNLFKRYLSKESLNDTKNRLYPNYRKELELLAYCLMPNHIHTLVYQNTPMAMTKLFQSIMTTYGMYFNKKYKRKGPVFESRFRASLVSNDAYLMHITRYIHLNPVNYKTWPYSSLPYYLNKQSAEWLKPKKILSMFDGTKDYNQFVKDYEAHKEMLDELKYELAEPIP